MKHVCLVAGIVAGLTIGLAGPASAAIPVSSPVSAPTAAEPVRINRVWFTAAQCHTYSACESIGKWYVDNGAAAYSVEPGAKYGVDLPWVVRVLD